MAKKYYWLKLKQDFFTSRAIKKLRKIAGGDTYTIIYLKLQLLSLKDDGVLFFEGIEPTFQEEMALALDEDVENVQATLIFLENAGLMNKKSDSEYVLSEVPYLIGGESESAERMRRLRDKKASQCDGHVTECANMFEQVTQRREEIEKDLDTEKEINKKRGEENPYHRDFFIKYKEVENG